MGVPALLLLYCGLRRGELIALTWNDVDLKAKSITINKSVIFVDNQAQVKSPKSSSGVRTIPIPDTILEALKQSRKGAISTMVCPLRLMGP